MNLLLPARCGFALIASTVNGYSQAQSPPLASYDQPNNVLRLDWESPGNRTFFPQISTDLISWDYIGALHFGPGSHVGMIQSTAPRNFSKLRYSDLPVVNESEAESADFDLDELPNITELEDSHTDPLDADTDKDGLPDGWEVAHGISPTDDGSTDPSNGPEGEFGGGSSSGSSFGTFTITTNAAAFSAGVGAHAAATLADKDGDGIPNERDAGPKSLAIDWETDGKPAKFLYFPVSGYNYSLHGALLGCNDAGDIIASQALFSGGAWHTLGQIATGYSHLLPGKIRVDGRDHDTYVNFQPQATSVSNSGQIVGTAIVNLEPISEEVGPDEWEDYEPGPTKLAFIWDSWAATPRLLAHAPGGVVMGNSWDETVQIAADGSVTVRRRAFPTVPSNTSYVIDQYTTSGVSTTPPFTSSLIPSLIGNGGFIAFNDGVANAYSWLPGSSPVSLIADSIFSTPNPRSYYQTYVEPTYLGEKPGPAGGYGINFWGKAMIRNGGKWREGTEMGDATLVTTKGIAFRARIPNDIKVWKAGDTVQTLNEAVPNRNFSGINTYLLDSTSDGRVLVNFFSGGVIQCGFLVPVDIKEVISDQFAGIELNKLPSPFYGGVTSTANANKPCEGGGGTGYPNNPLLMGTRTDGNAYLKVNVHLGDIDAAFVPDKLLVGLRVVHKDTRQPTESETRIAVKPLPSPAITNVSFTPLSASSDLLPFYEVVYGWDENGDGKLQQTEVAGNFQKTPLVDSMGTPSTSDTHLADLIHISSPTHIDYCVDELADITFWQSYGMEYSEDFINSFIEGDKTEVTSNSHVTETTTTITAAEPTELSHPVGLIFNSSGVATTHKFNFDKDSELSKDAYRSQGLNTLLGNLAIEKHSEIVSAAPALPGEHSFLLVEIPIGTGICFPGDYGDYSLDLPSYEMRLFYGVKKAFIAGAVLFRIDRYYNDANLTTQRLEISWDEIEATMDDIYDFSYATPQFPRQASIVQSGFTGVGTKGKVFGVHAVLEHDPDPVRVAIIHL